MPAELPLVPSATLLAASALLFFAPTARRSPYLLGTISAVAAAIAPIALAPAVDPTRASGRALWQWSAIGGPSIEASYLLDPLAVLSLSLVVGSAGAALALAGRAERRHVALGALVLGVGLVAMALVVTDDLVAAVVVLAVLAALTVLALFAVSPVAAMARAAGQLSIGVQAWVLAALLISRSGSATFLLTAVPQASITDGAVLAATVGALLCAGLYPAVAWDLDERRGAADVGPLGALVAMPIAIGASVLLIRLLGAGARAPWRIALPETGLEPRLVAVGVVLVAVSLALASSRSLPLRPIAVGLAAIVLIGLLPQLRWSGLVLVALALTVGYAASVSLAMPDQWETARGALGLVALWTAVATASPLGIAGAVVALGARIAAALLAALWLVPHRDYLAFVGTSSAYLVGLLAVGAGAVAANDLSVAAGAVVLVAVLVLLELAQVARRYRIAQVPFGLDLVSALTAIGVALIGAMAVVPAGVSLGGASPTPSALAAALGIGAGALVVVARTVRPLLPTFELAAVRAGPAMRALDPAPIAVGAFRAVEVAATRGSSLFAVFEQRAGVAVSAAVIAALLFWASR